MVRRAYRHISHNLRIYRALPAVSLRLPRLRGLPRTPHSALPAPRAFHIGAGALATPSRALVLFCVEEVATHDSSETAGLAAAHHLRSFLRDVLAATTPHAGYFMRRRSGLTRPHSGPAPRLLQILCLRRARALRVFSEKTVPVPFPPADRYPFPPYNSFPIGITPSPRCSSAAPARSRLDILSTPRRGSVDRPLPAFSSLISFAAWHFPRTSRLLRISLREPTDGEPVPGTYGPGHPREWYAIVPHAQTYLLTPSSPSTPPTLPLAGNGILQAGAGPSHSLHTRTEHCTSPHYALPLVFLRSCNSRLRSGTIGVLRAGAIRTVVQLARAPLRQSLGYPRSPDDNNAVLALLCSTSDLEDFLPPLVVYYLARHWLPSLRHITGAQMSTSPWSFPLRAPSSRSPPLKLTFFFPLTAHPCCAPDFRQPPLCVLGAASLSRDTSLPALARRHSRLSSVLLFPIFVRYVLFATPAIAIDFVLAIQRNDDSLATDIDLEYVQVCRDDFVFLISVRASTPHSFQNVMHVIDCES
ncbi:hypothetical protein C8J57DRAFT_1718117 [Mycena rebaudengoi]|nr:hypothetical protein C8J57DRAFT_1718117 [Mycena rebaudengoi]